MEFIDIVTFSTDPLVSAENSDVETPQSSESSVELSSSNNSAWSSDWEQSSNNSQPIDETWELLKVKEVKYSDKFPKEMRPKNVQRRKRGLRRFKAMCIESTD